ncbi:flavin-containing monooxygenase [Novosphingobium sp. B 225]|uniref:flavin-containing monooxygenase n=1 Tax=Novosphingobium sp. B 225 TaxID=1961849 RepID=UPI000B4BC342|nr:NAD(P)/FAD-dependent oxidoreductase [Novosphingobium sp. B 225]
MNSKQNSSATESPLRFVIIGAGMGGILTAIKLKEAGFNNFVIVEKGDSVGGTWRENSYPGLHCDFPSHFYSYSFFHNPNWSRRFSPGAEIRDYLESAARHFGVHEAIQFNIKVTEGRWDGAAWTLELEGGRSLQCDVLLAATGYLHVPNFPDIDGLDDFEGPKFHTAQWDHSVALEDKRIGIIGTGSTSTQLVAELAGKVRNLTVFQRTPQWVVQQDNPAYSEAEKRAFAEDPSLLVKMYEEQKAEMVALADGAILGGNADARAYLVANVHENLARVKDPELRRKLTPDYEPGCKRIVISPRFYEAIQDPGCELVTEPIDRIEAGGVKTVDGTLHELDVLVIATGYDTQAFFRPLNLIGEDGRRTDEIWQKRPVAFRTMTIPHMPNFFMVEGPFSPIGNVCAFLTAELQVAHIIKLIEVVAEQHVAIAPREDKTAELLETYRDAARTTIWATGGCVSWYQDDEGVPTLYPFSNQTFEAEMTTDPDLTEYVLTPLSGRDMS